MTRAADTCEASCQGCGAGTTTAFQCPLCQAEGATDRGFFCTQECFAKNWLEHRNTAHKSGVVRERKAVTTKVEESTSPKDKGAKKKKRTREAAGDEKAAGGAGAEQQPQLFAPWPPLPSTTVCKEKQWAIVTPALPLDAPRAVVRPSSTISSVDASLYSWPAMLAAAQYTAASVAAVPSMQVLVVAGDVYTAHAFAWAARCAGLTSQLQLAVSSTAPAVESPFAFFTKQRCVVVATAAAVRASALRESMADSAVSGAAALWLTGPSSSSLLVTLPDVAEAADLQAVQTRAIFFTGPTGLGEEEEALVDYRYTGLERFGEEGKTLRWTPVNILAPGTSLTPAVAAASSTEAAANGAESAATATTAAITVTSVPSDAAAGRLDDEACTSLANGDLTGALDQMIRLYTTAPGHVESSLFYLLCSNWGAASLVHAHHRLAYVARILVDASARFTGIKNASLADVALRAVAAVVRLLPAMEDEVAMKTSAPVSESPKKSRKTTAQTASSTVDASLPPVPTLAGTTRPTPAVTDVSAPSALELARYANYYTHLPNLQLQATVCHLYAAAPPAVLDTFARAWGLFRYLPGPSTFVEVERARSAASLRVRQRYATRLDNNHGAFYVTLMHLIYDAVGPYSLPVAEVQRRLQWDLTLAYDAGPLEAFLRASALLPTIDGVQLPTAKKQKARRASTASTPVEDRALSSRLKPTRETPQSRAAQLRCYEVKTTTASTTVNFGFVELPWKAFPITGVRQREVGRLHASAVEEVLMAMPREPRPMYVGDVGNLIGKWAHFNSRFDGVLGATLQVFLEAHPEAFRVVDRFVTRRTAGSTEQVRIRFDAGEAEGSDGDDDDDRKNRDRRLLTGQKGKGEKTPVELPARARKKRALKAFNKERFNRNYKSVNAEARVPGYIKHAPRRIKGRGNKANKRTVKRGN